MERVMIRLTHAAVGCLCLWLGCVPAAAQTAAAPASETSAPAPSSFWLVAGGSFSTLRGDCQECEQDFPYRHAGGLLVNAGYRANSRMDVGAEVFWMPVDTASGRIRTTHVDAVAQFRPWQSSGFFVKGGAGIAFVRDWVDVPGTEPVTSKALSVVIGAGWMFRPAARVGVQVFGAQHTAALGDLRAGESSVQDVIGNFWSVGAAIVIR
jgi:hypothetical protein